MTANRTGLTISPVTLKWFNLIVALAALVGPFASFYTATKVDAARTVGRFQENEQRIGRTERDITEIKAGEARVLERIDDRLQKIEQGLARLAGQLKAEGRIPTTSSTIATAIAP